MDLTNRKFGLLTVTGLHHRAKVSGGTLLFWACRCECGGEGVVAANNLRSGNTKSCGCLKKKAGERTKTHGMSGTKAYELWSAMIQRGRGNRAETYAKRGIVVCERWKSFESFLEDVGHPPGPGYSIERVDNDKGYEPGNCVWLPMSDQWRNRTNTSFHQYGGKQMTLREISEVCGIGYATLRHRVKVQGMSLEQATTTPPRQTGRRHGLERALEKLPASGPDFL